VTEQFMYAEKISLQKDIYYALLHTTYHYCYYYYYYHYYHYS
jgi:hypothetical protein